MVVGRGYFSHASSHSENVASARRVQKPQPLIVIINNYSCTEESQRTVIFRTNCYYSHMF